jgi:hypothetical protein
MLQCSNSKEGFMQPNVKPEPTHNRAPSPFSFLSEWIQQGVDSYVATQRILLDLVMRQNATTMNAIRQTMSMPRHVSMSEMAELAGEGMTNFIDAQRVILGLASRQHEILMTGVKERVGDRRATAVVNIIHRSVATLIDMQQHFLLLASKETGSWMEAAKKGDPDPRPNISELVREGMEQLVRSQKKFLDVIAEETAHAAEPHPEKHKHEPTKLSDLVGQSAESLIETQKKILDVAGKQVDLHLKTARKAMDLMPPRIEMTKLTKEYVENFVAAQKALLDIMVKPKSAAHAAQASGAAEHATRRASAHKGGTAASSHSRPRRPVAKQKTATA